MKNLMKSSSCGNSAKFILNFDKMSSGELGFVEEKNITFKEFSKINKNLQKEVQQGLEKQKEMLFKEAEKVINNFLVKNNNYIDNSYILNTNNPKYKGYPKERLFSITSNNKELFNPCFIIEFWAENTSEGPRGYLIKKNDKGEFVLEESFYLNSSLQTNITVLETSADLKKALQPFFDQIEKIKLEKGL